MAGIRLFDCVERQTDGEEAGTVDDVDESQDRSSLGIDRWDARLYTLAACILLVFWVVFALPGV